MIMSLRIRRRCLDRVRHLFSMPQNMPSFLNYYGTTAGRRRDRVAARAGNARQNAELLINHRSRMVLRAAKSRVENLKALSGQTIQLGNARLTFGNMREKPINLHTPLYAHCVTTGGDDEASFNQVVMSELDRLEIDARFICGRRQTIRLPDGDIYGFSLMLHGISVPDAVRIQETGLGLHRRLGCGIFIPHKSIKALE